MPKQQQQQLQLSIKWKMSDMRILWGLALKGLPESVDIILIIYLFGYPVGFRKGTLFAMPIERNSGGGGG